MSIQNQNDIVIISDAVLSTLFTHNARAMVQTAFKVNLLAYNPNYDRLRMEHETPPPSPSKGGWWCTLRPGGGAAANVCILISALPTTQVSLIHARSISSSAMTRLGIQQHEFQTEAENSTTSLEPLIGWKARRGNRHNLSSLSSPYLAPPTTTHPSSSPPPEHLLDVPFPSVLHPFPLAHSQSNPQELSHTLLPLEIWVG